MHTITSACGLNHWSCIAATSGKWALTAAMLPALFGVARSALLNVEVVGLLTEGLAQVGYREGLVYQRC